MLCVGLSVAGIMWTLLAEDVLVGRILPGTAIGLGLVASILSGLNSLAVRWARVGDRGDRFRGRRARPDHAARTPRRPRQPPAANPRVPRRGTHPDLPDAPDNLDRSSR